MIPVVPMPVFPDLDWGPVLGQDLRAADADRDVAADILCAAVADGRLTLAELDERLEHVLSARTLREIARLISDLNGPRLSGAVRAGTRPPAPRRRAVWTKPPAWPKPPVMPRLSVPALARPRPVSENRWSLLQALLAPGASR
jgi:hypothetical protein